ncbi:MAG: hypothetical protein ACT6R2_12355 [Blastomonas fulva]|jgi:hypothetical protein|uniref:Uncharacterized protein n=1 Tax=Blastomonas fulva TaxID=1550728 RepID=A0ABM6M4N5_9SPHN|nr:MULTISPECIES: hypothetical protein [Blastomonas]AOG01449.1 hypothetical protein BSY18_2765 [Blastomonas sp. RAC04]ASR50873.1 hypothetical protein B5J99_04780 [Blastomonas fulva]MCO5791665.1 hypothetical protein [Blastomonas sp.]MDK2755489.1 hypothetical protein [Blastomonas fulva]MDM7927929.1 hypothetical protein [Blastomonas fulva]
MKSLLLLLSLQTAAVPAAPAAPAPAPVSAPALTPAQREDLTCAAAFAIIASEQARGVTSALAYPTLVVRGRSYFVATAERIVTETATDDDAVGLALTRIVEDLQAQAAQSNDPAGVVDAIMTPCLAKLDAAVPLPPPPSMLQCAIYLQLAFDEVAGREGDSATARDLKTLATVLESRARDEMRDEGLSGNEADRRFIETREAIDAREKARAPDDDATDVDFEHCFTLAKPAEKR